MAGFTSIFKKNQKKNGQHKHLADTEITKVLPERQFHFYSDYFTVDNEYATILTIFNKQGADRGLPPFWMCWLIPQNLGKHVEARLFSQVTTMDQKWIDRNQSRADASTNQSRINAITSSSSKDYEKLRTRVQDMQMIAEDFHAGDSYLAVDFKVLIKAPTLAELDGARLRYEQYLKSQFGGITVSVYQGQQRQDFANIFRRADEQLGRAKYFTSSELAGGYNLVTHGINDTMGEYVGIMKHDVNNAAIVFDVDDFDKSVIVASGAKAATLTFTPDHFEKHARSSTLWGVKLAQSALIDDHRVIHLVLNGARPAEIGINLDDITTDVSMNAGGINPFEMFGSVEKELSVYPAHSQKLRLMAKQISPELTDTDLNKTLTDILENFYIDNGMLVENPKLNRERLRLVGLPHDQYPLLNKFNAYLAQKYEEAIKRQNGNEIASVERLQGVFSRMAKDNSDLFNVITDDTVDDANRSPQVIYDFSSLKKRGAGIAMAQFVNALGYATGSLRSGDLVIIHGADQIADSVEKYVDTVLTDLKRRDVRVAYLYDSVDDCLADAKFNHLVDSDWTLFGKMSNPNVTAYQNILENVLPEGLKDSLTKADDVTYFLSRGVDNVIFDNDLILGDVMR